MWQELIVGACVLVAVAFLVRRYWPGKKAGCDGCSGCDSKAACGDKKA